MSLLGVGLLLGTLIETNKIHTTIIESDLINCVENITKNIIDKITKRVEFIEPRVREQLIEITNCKSIGEFESVVLNQNSILAKKWILYF